MNSALAAERIRTLRDLHGWTQTELSRASGVSQALISSIENLQRDASKETLAAIAAAAEMPLSFFDVVPTAPADSLHYRKNRSAPVRLTKQVQSYFREGHRVSLTLLNEVNHPIGELPLLDRRSDDIDTASIDALALDTRAALGLPSDTPIPNVTRSLERVGIAVFQLALPGAEENGVVGRHHFGLSFWSGHGEPAAIGYFRASGDRDRFTLGHELGHLVLHTFRKSESSAETEAHQFAGALLLPKIVAFDLMSPLTTLEDYARIKAVFGISIQAAIMRASTLGIIDDYRKKSLMIQLSQRGWRTREPVEVAQESPLLLGKALHMRWPQSPYLRASSPLAMAPTILRSLAPSSVRKPGPGQTAQDADVVEIHARNRSSHRRIGAM